MFMVEKETVNDDEYKINETIVQIGEKIAVDEIIFSFKNSYVKSGEIRLIKDIIYLFFYLASLRKY